MKKVLRYYLKITKQVSQSLSQFTRWIAFLLVLIGIYEVFARYFLGSPTIWGYDMMCMTGGVLAVLAWGYVELKEEHVRVDVFYDSISERGRSLVDVIGGLLFGLPLTIVYIRTSYQWAIRAWASGEVLKLSFWYPSAVPIRVIILIGFILFFLQFLNTLIRRCYFLLKGEHL